MIEEFPAQLSDGNITQDEFNAWKKQLLQYLEEKPEYQLFLPGGMVAIFGLQFIYLFNIFFF